MAEGIIEFEVPQIRGLLPALDPKQVNAPFVIEGRNFIVDSEGPVSYFGRYNYNPHEVDFGNFPQTFRMNDTWVVAGDRGIWRYDQTEKRFYPMLIVPAPPEPWPWTMAKIGLKFYWARYGENLWQYDPATAIWTEITTAVPAGVRGCCASYGRLIVIGDDAVAWSQLDDGSNFVTSIPLGIGAQSLGIAGGGTPYGVYNVSNGFVCFMQNGMMKSQYTGAANPFFHQPIETEVSALSPFAITKIDKGPIIFVSTNGLWQMTESLPQPFQPLFSQFLVRKKFQLSAYQKSGVYMLSYLPRLQYLVLGIATTDVPLKFDEGYVLYLPRDEWGSYDNTFKNFGEFPDAFSTTGLIAPVIFNVNDRFMKQIVEFNAAEQDVDYGDSLCFKGAVTPDFARQQGGETIFSAGHNLYSVFYENGVPPAKKPSDLVNIGVYVDDPTLAAQARILGSLDSYVVIGLFRGRDQNFGDTLNIFTAAEVGSLPSGDLADFEDWLLIADTVDDQDWNVLTGFEDWGDNPAGLNNYKTTLEVSYDGVNVAESEVLDVYLEEDDIRFFRPNLTGKYARIRVETADATQSFHLKFLDISANLGGRIG